MNMGKPAGILFLIDQSVVRLPCPQALPPTLLRAVVVIKPDIEEAFAVRTPHHGAVGFLDQVFTVCLVGPVAHPDREILRALDISAPGMKPVIRRMPGAAELEIIMI